MSEDLVRYLEVVGVGAALSLFALALRLVVHVGTTPSGIDTWYYLASADDLRRRRRFPIRLPQYLLQDPSESYAPGFPVLLAVLPRGFLRKDFWLIAPAIDAVHLLLLYAVIYKLTESLPTAALGGLIYALVPQLVAETRSLNPRALGSLLASIAMLLILRYTLPDEPAATLTLGPDPPAIGALAVVAVAALLLTQSPTGGVTLGIATLALAVIYRDPRYLLLMLLGAAAAFALTGGFYARVLRNHVQALAFWRRNVGYRGADQVFDSPLYRGAARTARPGSRWRGLRWQYARLIGENPFVIPMILTPLPPSEIWGGRMYWWAIAILAWAFLTTAVPPLRIFGPGYIYLKASIFPTAFTLALAVGPSLVQIPLIAIVAGAAAMSVAAIAFFLLQTRRRLTELTSSAPPELARIAARAAALPEDGLLVLPNVYADYVCYHSGKRTLWGGHSGDLTRFEAFYPVIRRPLDELIAQYGLHYALFDTAYVTPADVRLEGRLREVAREGSFALYETGAAPGA